MTREEALKNALVFAELGTSDLKRLAKLMEETQFAAGSIVIKEGDQADGLFVVSSGKLEAVRGGSVGHAQPLATYGPGDFFGEMALFQGFPRSATVRAIEDSECLVMTREDFMAELKNHPKIAVGMLPALVRRLRNADVRIAE
jgi:CRP/FNR family cyclic AMP-dependent transcriptional regulator